ncbi:IclR family transcriptional regulator [Roseibium sp.]|uniref:IclR family transcriptional regulator n=1 Tax=Roseibium sp. TaxID=1936156 RepID=UPI003A97E988
MAGFDRYQNILRLFLDQGSLWTVADMSDALQTSASNVYRTVRELVAAGFLESAADSQYRLGPIFLEFEHRLRETDPLVRSGRTFLMPLVEQAGIPCCVVLARLYGDKVMCVADARSARFGEQTSYERGRPMPIMRGATSKAVLAGLSPRRRDKLLLKLSGKGELVTDTFRAELESIRKAGIVTALGEVDAGLAGIAVPMNFKALAVHASLSFVVKQSDLTEDTGRRLDTILRSQANVIENFIDPQ